MGISYEEKWLNGGYLIMKKHHLHMLMKLLISNIGIDEPIKRDTSSCKVFEKLSCMG